MRIDLRKPVAVLLAIGAAVVGLSVASSAQAVPAASTLLAGQKLQSLSDRSSLTSTSGEYTLSVLPLLAEVDQTITVGPGRGTLVDSPTWSTPALAGDGSDTTYLLMQTDGNLVLYRSDHHALWSSGTKGTGSANRLVMQTDGNLVVYTSGNRAVWASHSGPVAVPAGKTLADGQSLVSRTTNPGRPAYARLSMQTDGNLVVYLGSKALWSSRTFVRGSSAFMQTDGNLVIYSPARKAVWSSRTAGAGAATWLVLDQCGEASIFTTRHDAAIWKTPNTPVNC